MKIDLKDRKMARLEAENDELKAEKAITEKMDKIKKLISVLPEFGRTQLLFEQLMGMDTEEEMLERIEDQKIVCSYGTGEVHESGDEFNPNPKETEGKDTKKKVIEAVRGKLTVLKGGKV